MTNLGKFLWQVWLSYLHQFLIYRAGKQRDTDKRR